MSKGNYGAELLKREVPNGTIVRTISWPFYYWTALIPEKLTEDTPDIFEQLYVSLKKVAPNKDPKEIFQKLHISPELYKAYTIIA